MRQAPTHCPRDYGNGIIEEYVININDEHIFICSEYQCVWHPGESFESATYYFLEDLIEDLGYQFNQFRDALTKCTGGMNG